MRAHLLLATIVCRPLAFLKYGPARIEADQPFPYVFGGWSWSQANLDVVDHEPILSFLSRPASFGKRVTDPEGLPGYLIPVSSIITSCPTNSTASRDDELPENLSCPPVCTDPNIPPISVTENWIAIVQRGQCPFADKVRAAQSLGAKGVVVGGWPVQDGERDDLLNMFSPEYASDITIPSTYVTYRSYAVLMGLIAASNTTTSGVKTISVILRAEESWGWFSPIFTFLMLLLLPSFLTFLTLVIHRMREARRERLDRAPEDIVSHLPTRIWSGSGWEKESEWMKKLRRRAQDGQATSDPPADKPAVDDSSIDLEGQREDAETEGSLPRAIPLPAADNEDSPSEDVSHSEEPSSEGGDDDIPGKSQPWFNGQVECAICLSTFDPGDKVRILPCGHLFHIEEVDGWLVQRKKLCPICKMDVTLPSTSSSPPTPERHAASPTPILAGPRRIVQVREWFSRSLPGSLPFLSRSRPSTDNINVLPVTDHQPDPTERTPLLLPSSP